MLQPSKHPNVQRLNVRVRKFSTEFFQFPGSHSTTSVGLSQNSAGGDFSFLLLGAVWRAAISSSPCSVSPTALAHLCAAVRAEQLSLRRARDKQHPGRSGHSQSNKAERSDQPPTRSGGQLLNETLLEHPIETGSSIIPPFHTDRRLSRQNHARAEGKQPLAVRIEGEGG